MSEQIPFSKEDFLKYKKELHRKPGGSQYLVNDAKILEALITSNNPLMPIQIQRKTQIQNRGVIKEHLDKLVERGWVEKVFEERKERPKYRITEKGRRVYRDLRIEAERYKSPITDVTEIESEEIRFETSKEESVGSLKVKKVVTVKTNITGVVFSTTVEGFPSPTEKPKLYVVSAEQCPREGSVVLEFSPEYFAHGGSLSAHWTPEIVKKCHICGNPLSPDGICPYCATKF